MGIPDTSLLDLIEKVGSWIPWRGSHRPCLSRENEMPGNSCKMCCGCDIKFSEFWIRYHCQSCGRVLCGKCLWGFESYIVASSEENINSCKFCSEVSLRREGGRKNSEKIHPSASPRESPEPPSPCFGGEKTDGTVNSELIHSDRLACFLEARDYGYSPRAATSSTVTSNRGYPSPVSVRRFYSRSDEEEAEDSGKHFFSLSGEYYQDNSDIDTSSVSARHEFYSFKSVGSSPSDSPSRIDFTSNRVGHSVQQERERSPRAPNDGSFVQDSMAILRRPGDGTEDPENTDDCSDDLAIFQDQCEKLQKPLDFENNGFIWFPPPADDEDDEEENNFFEYDDEDDDIGESGAMFSSSTSLASMFPAKEKQNEGHKEPLRAVVQGHFRALVSQLLQGEGIKVGKEDNIDEWLDIVATVAWQAANFVKPDTSRGGSMDPGAYVKVKCIASGSPHESTLVKGVVCTKNIKHKRMTSQYKTPRLLVLGGALEYQRVPNQLASFNTLLQQEMDHLRMIVSKIEAHRTNVLLVEKSVSSYAQEYLLEKDISLVLNVKRPLLERIARCTGALITPSVDDISMTRLGHCELFRVERVSEELETANQSNKKPSKTLMFFEGCPRRLGCTVLLKGACREELKKVKHVVQYAVFAAYHLSLETSFLADEGASLPKMTLKPSITIPDRTTADNVISSIPHSAASTVCQAAIDAPAREEGSVGFNTELGGCESSSEHINPGPISPLSPDSMDGRLGNIPTDAHNDDLASSGGLESYSLKKFMDLRGAIVLPADFKDHSQPDLQDTMIKEEMQPGEIHELAKPEQADENEVSSEYFSGTDSHQSILVSFSSRSLRTGTVCERSRLMRIKFYGCFDKPLGRYLRDDLFDQTPCCSYCREPADAHVQCYTHQQGSLTINVKCLPSMKLPGERDGKIWMWHRCLRCAQIDGVPPATRRVFMSDAAWGLSFGKFLELSFSNHATANRVATCGHSLQRDCLRFYGFGSMVAFFRYSPIDILSVHLPPAMLEFNGQVQQEWIRKEASELLSKIETAYVKISDVLDRIEQKTTSFRNESSDKSELHNHIMDLKDLLNRERNDYNNSLQPSGVGASPSGQVAVDILELNCLRRSLLIGSHIWDQRLSSLDSLLETRISISKNKQGEASHAEMKGCSTDSFLMNSKLDHYHEENVTQSSKIQDSHRNDMLLEHKEEINPSLFEPQVPENSMLTSGHDNRKEEAYVDEKNKTLLESIPSPASYLSDKIDSAWTGTDQHLMKPQFVHTLHADGNQAGSVRQINQIDTPPFRRPMSPVRVYSFDSAVRVQERIRKGLPPSSLHLSTLRSFHASGDYRNMVRDPVSSVMRTYSQLSPREAQKVGSTSSFFSSSHMAEGARLLLPQTGHGNLVIAVYDNEPTSIISYALSSKKYEDWVADKLNEHEGGWSANESNKEDSSVSTLAWPSFGPQDLDYIHYGSYGSEDSSSAVGTLFTDTKKSPHLRISFGDESSNAGGKVKFSVTCYFAKQFDTLRKKCCPNEVDFVRSLSRCKRWSAQGGKSNVYFAKSLDERFIIKQVTKTELVSFEKFAHEYFKYLTHSLSSGSPTCLAKILGIYQVTVKNLKGGKETKMDLMVMENLFFKRNISRVYDLKGSARCRYNADATGANKVLLDTNLLETLCTKPIFLGSKAKRSLERAIWNDTSFLASVDVMDYSLLVGVDDERKELVLGIIDFMRQYTWDKHLETWVKASGILGGPKNASPTIISPIQYKRRFRKAMTTYFLAVPDQWSS